MAVTDYLNQVLRIEGKPPDLDPAHHSYYPEDGVEWMLIKNEGGRYTWTPVKPVEDRARIPLYWAGSEYQLLGDGDTVDPEHPEVPADQPRFFGVVLLVDTYYYVWFVENEAGFSCIARSLGSGRGHQGKVVNGGYNHG